VKKENEELFSRQGYKKKCFLKLKPEIRAFCGSPTTPRLTLQQQLLRYSSSNCHVRATSLMTKLKTTTSSTSGCRCGLRWRE